VGDILLLLQGVDPGQGWGARNTTRSWARGSPPWRVEPPQPLRGFASPCSPGCVEVEFSEVLTRGFASYNLFQERYCTMRDGAPSGAPSCHWQARRRPRAFRSAAPCAPSSHSTPRLL